MVHIKLCNHVYFKTINHSTSFSILQVGLVASLPLRPRDTICIFLDRSSSLQSCKVFLIVLYDRFIVDYYNFFFSLTTVSTILLCDLFDDIVV
jgi:hypothetical protein